MLIPKILFWIEGATIHFGIAKFLKERLDCEIYGIIDVNSEKEFFEKQKIVDFKKIWFYRDEIIKRQIIESEYLKKFEEKYKIDLLKLVYSDVWFHKYNYYYKYSLEEIIKILENDCMFFEKVLDEIKPEYLMIRMSDASHMELLQMLCKAKGIKILTLGPTRFGYRALISNEIDKFDESHSIDENIVKDYSINDVLKLMQGYKEQEIEQIKKYKTSKIEWLNGALHFLSLVLDPQYSKYYRHFGMNLFSVIRNEINITLKRQRSGKFIDRNLSKNMIDGKFIYFPLHLEPERTTRIAAPFFSDQLEIIRNTAKSIPIEYKLFVKEHPMQKLKGWRDISFYKEIMNMPNVELFHHSVSSNDMIQKSSLVLTINGTSALEAALFNKPSIIFADTIFSELPSVLRVTSWEELPDLIKRGLTTKINFSDMQLFVNKIIQNSFEIDDRELERKFINRFYYGGNLLDSKISEDDMYSFLEENKDALCILADAHLKYI